MDGTNDAPRRILVVANETCAGKRVVEEVRYRAGSTRAQVLVVAPILARTRMEHWLSADMERRRAEAQERLERSVAALTAAGLDARGEVGDAHPLQALDDAARTFRPHEVIISTHPPARSNWLEDRVVEEARERYTIPVTHVVVDVERESADTVSRDPHATPREPAPQVVLYHAAQYDQALRIREEGFQDAHGQSSAGPGVLLTDQPPTDSDEDAPLVFAVRIAQEAAERYAQPADEGGARRYVVPAGLINASGPPELVSELSE